MTTPPTAPQTTEEKIAEAALALAPFVGRFTPEGLLVLRDVYLSHPQMALSIAVGAKDTPNTNAERTEGMALAKTLHDRLAPIALDAFVDLYVKNPAAAQQLAAAMPPVPARLTPATPKLRPPAPTHKLPTDPGYERTPEDKSAAINEFVAEIKRERPMTFSEAWTIAQRRRPSLFTR